MTTAGNWRYAGASVIGTSHGKSGSPCQDKHDCRIFWEKEQPILAIAVSDGAGSATNSTIGASITCATLLEQVEVFLSEGGNLTTLCDANANEWLKAVREAIADHASDGDFAMRDYACTL